MTVEEQLREALAQHAATVPAPRDRWQDVETQASGRRLEERRRARLRARGLVVVAVAACAAAAAFALPALTRGSARRVVSVRGSQPTTAVTNRPEATTVAPHPAPTTTAPAGTGTGPGPTAFSYLPLYPFANLQDVATWQAAYRAHGDQPWHLDPGQTALSFTRFLGYSDVTTVLGTTTDDSGAHVTVGFPVPVACAPTLSCAPHAPVHAAVVHLRRFGTAGDAPWEVVGTDDTPSFSLTTPRYGAVARSPLAVAGALVGVDESIRVQVLQASSPTPLGVSCCQPAGTGPWSASVTFHAAPNSVLIVAASTGGHVATVERFTVTGIRTMAGTTPGL